MPGPSGLTEKHLKLLELIKMNKYTLDELAQRSGLTDVWVSDLITGNPATGEVGKLFQIELKKIDKEIEARISWKNNVCREKLVNILTQWSNHATGDNVDSKTRHKMLVDGINALNKAMPYQVNVENYTWKEGMTAEEAVNEYKRIKGLAKQYAIRGRISELAAAGSAEGSVSDGLLDQEAADNEDTVLPPKPQAEDVSRIKG
jgi:transcriptional regulator with XRE-family HTH domain